MLIAVVKISFCVLGFLIVQIDGVKWFPGIVEFFGWECLSRRCCVWEMAGPILSSIFLCVFLER